MLGFAAEGWMNFREGPQRPSLMLLCRDPGLKPSCQVRTTMSETAGWLQVQWSIVQKHEKLRRSAISGRFLKPQMPKKTWMFILLGWRGILCNYDALFTLEAILSAPMITVCAGRTNTPSSHQGFLCIFWWLRNPKMLRPLPPTTRGQTRAFGFSPVSSISIIFV